ncbi:MAG: hypothetical protein QM758_20420 [Armatimonas sp.]
MRSPAARGWPVWKIYTRQPESFKKIARRPWGCVGVVAVLLLLWQGVLAALAALLAGQVLPLLVLLLGQLYLGARLLKLAKEIRTPCPDKDALAPFLGRLTEKGLKLASGHTVPWASFSGWAPGWEDSHVFRIHFWLAPGQDTRSLMQARPRKWLFANTVSVIVALYLALTLPGQGKALLACVYFGAAYLALFLLRRWSSAALRKSQQANTTEEPWVLLFDTRHCSVDEVEALLERHLPRKPRPPLNY